MRVRDVLQYRGAGWRQIIAIKVYGISALADFVCFQTIYFIFCFIFSSFIEREVKQQVEHNQGHFFKIK